MVSIIVAGKNYSAVVEGETQLVRHDQRFAAKDGNSVIETSRRQ